MVLTKATLESLRRSYRPNEIKRNEKSSRRNEKCKKKEFFGTIASVKAMALPFIRFSPITPYAIRFFSSRSFRQLVAPCHVVVVWTMTNIPLPLSYLFHFFGARAPRSFGECDMGKESWKKSLRDFSLLARWPQGEAFTGRWSPGLSLDSKWKIKYHSPQSEFNER